MVPTKRTWSALMTTVTRRMAATPFADVHPRTKKVLRNSFWGLLIRGGNVLISLVSIPITFDYLGRTTYGVWLTFGSLITLLSLLDIGLGNGLRNRFAEAVSAQQTLLARSYLSTAYVLYGGWQVAASAVFVVINQYLPWSRILNTDVDTEQLRTVALIVFLSVSIRLVLDLLTFVLHALQESARAGAIQLLAGALSLGAVYYLSRQPAVNLIRLAGVTALTPLGIMLVGSLILYRTRLRAYCPSLRFVNRRHMAGLLRLGYQFFFIQIAVIVIFYTDNFIISQLFGPAEVPAYTIAYRYFNLAATVFAILTTPFWSAFTEAYVQQDYVWMQTAYRRLQQAWAGLFVGVTLMLFVADYAYGMWLGNRVTVPLLLSGCTALSVLITGWNNVTVLVTNGLGKLQLQLYYALFSAVINVPLAVLFGRQLGMGSAGVALATCVCLLTGSVVGGIQAHRLLARTAAGIWNQ